MGNTEVRKDMVRRAFSSANLRLLPSTDPTPVKLEFLRRVDTLSISSDTSPNLSESANIPSSERTTTTTSTNDSTHHIQEAIGQKRSKQIIHTRGQESIDIANGSFFQTADAKDQSHHGALSRIPLTDNAEDISDFFDIAFGTVNESQASTTDDKLICQADNHHKAQSTYSFSAQSFKGVEMVRRQRAFFATRLESELKMQKEAMEAAFEKCYDTSDRLHEIDLLNLREDHVAEVKYLQDERDVALFQVKSLTAKREDLESDVRTLDANNVCLNEALKEKTEEAESFQSQAGAFWQENIELERQASNVGNPDLTQFYELTAEKERLLTQLRLVGTERDALCIQNAELFKHCDDVYAACKEVQKEKDLAKRRFDAVLEEKSNDYSWHAQAHRCALELKPEDHEQAESHATAMARELYRREAEKVASLRRRLAEAFSQDNQKLRQQDEVISQLSDEVRCSAEVLYAVQHEKKELAARYQNLLAVVSDDSKRSELTCGLARDLQTSFEERMLFGLAFFEAELEIARGERYRRARICDLRDSIQEKDDELAELNKQLRQEQLSNEAKDLDISLRDVEIEQTIPALKTRILELEQIMELQAVSPSQYRSAVITDLQSRLDEQTRRNGCYEHFLDKKIDEMQYLRTEWSFWLRTTTDDLQLARGFRDQRDILEIECLAMRERFANELLIQPLVVPETMKTTKQIEEDQLENMHQGVLKQFLDTYKALPKWIVEPGCPGYETLRAEHMDAERARLDTEREKIDRSFFVEGQSSEGDAYAWISRDRDEFF